MLLVSILAEPFIHSHLQEIFNSTATLNNIDCVVCGGGGAGGIAAGGGGGGGGITEQELPIPIGSGSISVLIGSGAAKALTNPYGYQWNRLCQYIT